MDALERELLTLICTTCNLHDVDTGRIDPADPLIGSDAPLGIDSLDALEIAVAVQQHYGVRIDSEKTSREVMQTLGTLADHVRNGLRN